MYLYRLTQPRAVLMACTLAFAFIARIPPGRLAFVRFLKDVERLVAMIVINECNNTQSSHFLVAKWPRYSLYLFTSTEFRTIFRAFDCCYCDEF